MEEVRRSAVMQIEPLEKLEWKEEGRERNAIRAAKRAAESKGVKNKYLGIKNPFKNDKSR